MVSTDSKCARAQGVIAVPLLFPKEHGPAIRPVPPRHARIRATVGRDHCYAVKPRCLAFTKTPVKPAARRWLIESPAEDRYGSSASNRGRRWRGRFFRGRKCIYQNCTKHGQFAFCGLTEPTRRKQSLTLPRENQEPFPIGN
jgi:hypothetical protein